MERKQNFKYEQKICGSLILVENWHVSIVF